MGLRAKLTGIIALLIIATAGTFGIYAAIRQTQLAANTMNARAQDIGRALRALSPVWMPISPVSMSAGGNAAEKHREKKRALEQFVGSDRDGDSDGHGDGDDAVSAIAYLVIKHAEEIYFSHGDADAIQDQEPIADPLGDGLRIAENDRYIQVTIPVRAQDGRLCTAVAGFSHDSIEPGGGVSVLVVGVVILLLGVGVSWLLVGSISTPVLDAAQKLDSVSNSLVAAAREQEASAAEEAAAVAQTRRSMETLLDSAQQIADRSSEVLGNAERSTNGSQQIAERIGNLNELAERVAELLGVIMQVADKADLLALNASLEGTRAGEAGKGFALVAAEMRRLAENVVESVSGIRELMKDMREASQSAVVASQEGTKSSTATTRSAREIALLTQEQRQATEQVIASMDEMGNILNHTLDGIQRTTASASQLTELSGKLSRMVNPALRGQPSEIPERDSIRDSIELT